MRLLKPLPLVAAAALALGGVGTAFATGLISTVTSGQGSYTACVNNATGVTRIVNDASACRSTEVAIQLQGAIPLHKDITVHCAAGDNINDAIAQAGPRVFDLQVIIDGTCTQFVGIARDNVTLVAAHPGDGIVAPDNSDAALTTFDPARNIGVDGLTITGGIYAGGSGLGFGNATIHGRVTAGNGEVDIYNSTIDGGGISADGGSIVRASGTTISNSTDVGVQAGSGAVVLLKKSAIVNSGFQGAQATDGGTIQLIDTSISGSPDVGALAWSGGVIGTDGGTISGNGGGIGANAGTVRVHATHITGNNRFGVQAYDGGRVTLLGPQIDSNHGPGVNLLLNSSASIGGTITKNDGVGVALSGGSMADVGSASISGNGGAYDVQCFGPLSGIAAQVPPGLTTNCQNG